jgi:acyl carrier protein
MKEKILSLIKEKFNKDIELNSNLTELAGDSFGKIEMLFALEQELGRKIPEQEIIDIETVQDLLDVVEKTK